MQSDPMGQAGGLNLYAYVANPLTQVDVLGLTHNAKAKAESPNGKGNKRAGEHVESPPGKKPKFGEPGAESWRYERYRNKAIKDGKLEKDILTSEQYRKRYYEPAANGGRPGRAGSPAHQADVNETLNANPNSNPEAVGNRVPDALGKPGQPMNIRGETITPEGNGKVIVESDKTIHNGTIPDSQARAQVRDMRDADPNATLVVTDYKNPNAKPLVYPPGTQPPPPGRLGTNPPVSVPYPD